uniref:Uncharacterized protein n=1 Tax=Myoviridae sp. ctwwN25 TaxID=2825209 RepID=A0A8S5PPY6_9CAUD|nr:MAG TPA: hypothetical protein [Myoviridae sp. ctwwN25]
MKKNTLETLEGIVKNLEEVISQDYDPNNFQDVDIYKSISILKNKVSYYRSNYDVLETLRKATLEKEKS